MSDVVDEVKEKIDIADIIGEHVALKKAGKNLRGLCPFHGEKTPSFMVSTDLQIFKCFGCGESGDVFTFLQKHEGMDFPQALSFLADKAGVRLPEYQSEHTSHKEELFKAHEKVAQFYQYILFKHPTGKKALEYLLTERGLDQETLKTFGIGYSPDVPFAMKGFVVDRNKISPKTLSEAGIIYSRNGRHYDRFRGRIVFPLYDTLGRAVGFSGRLMPGVKKELAKYINSPETDIYHKSKILFGLNVTKNTIKKTESVVLTEGELDMISSWKIGIRNVVAIKGSALTQDHILLLKRFAKNVYFAFDSDTAGIKAIQRGIELSKDHGFVVKVVNLGEHKDPDEMAQKDPSGYKKAIDSAVPLWDFLIECVFDKYKREISAKTLLVSKEVVPILVSIDDTIVQSHYAQMVASRLDVSIESVIAQIEKAQKPPSGAPVSPVKPVIEEKSLTGNELLERSLLANALQMENKKQLPQKAHGIFLTKKYKDIYEHLLEFVRKHKTFDLKHFSEEIPSELRQSVVDLALGEEAFSDDNYENQFNTLLASLEKMRIKGAIKETTQHIARFEKTKESKKIREEQRELARLVQELGKLEKK